jgi:hypothetical protein
MVLTGSWRNKCFAPQSPLKGVFKRYPLNPPPLGVRGLAFPETLCKFFLLFKFPDLNIPEPDSIPMILKAYKPFM